MSLLKRIIHFTYRPWAIRYIKKDRKFRYKGLKLEVPRGVFHPGLFFSSKLLAQYILKNEISGKTLLELGCGSGMISCVAARSGAKVTASDINPKAVSTAKSNAELNALSIETIESDLFDSLTGRKFDWIVINPPYYPQKANSMAQRAWFAGADHEYFQKLFDQLAAHMHVDTHVIMSASEDVDIPAIDKIALSHSFEFEVVENRWTIWERNFIYQLRNSA